MENMYMNRELSWLKFNERVLEEAENPQVPLCERMNFVSIYQSNLDEFFRVRVGSLQDQMLLNKKIRDSKTNMTSEEQIRAILKGVKKLNKRKDAAYKDLMEKVAGYGITLVDFTTAKPDEKKYLEQYFNQEIVPLSSPTVVGKRQPFPFLRNQEIYAVVVLETRSGKERIGIIPCTNNMIERLIELPGGKGRYILSENIVLHYIGKVFKGYKVIGKSLIRVIRNADIDADALYDEDLDYREFMADLMKERKKLSPVRLDMSREIDGAVVESLCRYLDVSPERVFRSEAPLDLSFVFQLEDLLRMNPELYYEKRVPQKSASFRDGESVLRQIEEGDKLLSYPYESIRPFLNMLYEAAEDDSVISIKMTLYRLAKQSKIVEALCEAAENGKEVVVLVELRARFDEENNIRWSRMLEKAGCQIIYGLEGFKVHSKLCLITKKGPDGIEYITQIGTGNYNEKTARLYTDLSLMTTDMQIGIDAARVFQALTKGEAVEESEHLLVAPKCLQNRILHMIDEEIEHRKNGEDAYIGLKLNSLTDKKIIDKLAEASQAGVHIDMIIRGISCLVPGVKGKTDNIRIISIVGRFLEHSRIYIFGCGERRKYYISSADFMTRNTVKRVEVAAPVYDPAIKARIQGIFDLMLSDNQKARQEDAEGVYTLVKCEGTPVNSQEALYQQAYDSAARRNADAADTAAGAGKVADVDTAAGAEG
ncbi:MAG TPA: polyphosphate kinase 1 [Candidatus Mediterraneibacter merdipullorum]|nr:polyphosphate kinase 1 [Candidatus Mediterraneibacter merdipullorum]